MLRVLIAVVPQRVFRVSADLYVSVSVVLGLSSKLVYTTISGGGGSWDGVTVTRRKTVVSVFLTRLSHLSGGVP